jgi:hypothetical protein
MRKATNKFAPEVRARAVRMGQAFVIDVHARYIVGWWGSRTAHRHGEPAVSQISRMRASRPACSAFWRGGFSTCW